MQTHVQNTEYRDVPVAVFIESPSNPWKRFDESSLSELADYVSGHISCLLCRSPFCGRRQQTEYQTSRCTL
jgi:hypothetical protein